MIAVSSSRVRHPRDETGVELCGLGLGLSKLRDSRLLGGFLRNRSGARRGDRGARWTLNRRRENFTLSVQPIDVGLAVGLTVGDPEVVGPFANGFFQVRHGLLL